jgi:hypothetical protein
LFTAWKRPILWDNLIFKVVAKGFATKEFVLLVESLESACGGG